MGREYTKFWAGGFLYNAETNSVLLHKRDARAKVNPNQLAFFGGLNDGNETPEQTFARELQEELAITIPKEDIKSLCDYFNEELQTYRYVFFVESHLRKSEMRLREGEGFDWIPLEKVFEYALTEKTARDLKTFMRLRQ
jgi:8-oxo-dGTP pyrophosphatase MutT (NUDIX family)